MPRKRNLTWVHGADGRSGRWRKKYHGKIHYFSGGKGKSDSGAYSAALAEWEQTKLRIDAESPNPYQIQYELAIDDWERVLTWSRKHGDDAMSHRASRKLTSLRQGLTARPFQPLAEEDLFASHFDAKLRFPKRDDALKQLARTIQRILEDNAATGGYHFGEPQLAAINGVSAVEEREAVIVPSSTMIAAPDELHMEREIWRDRLEVMDRDLAVCDKTIKGQVAALLEFQRAKAASGQLSKGRVNALEIHLNGFADWLGGKLPVTEISGQTLSRYHTFLLNQVKGEVWSSTTANSRMVSVKYFVRWLWRTEAIATLPRIMDGRSKDLDISKSDQSIVVFTMAEISSLLARASARTRLYVLLTLNTSMTQKDIADLDFSEVDWQEGRVNRRRSKTKTHATVPIVSYRLWPETLDLLVQERNPEGVGRVLLNENGRPLWEERTDPGGRYSKNDNVRSAFDRLRHKLNISKPFKSLKKTAASELAGSKEYRSIRGLFLGHAPSNIADRHYARAPAELLDQALGWLRGRLEIEKNLQSVDCK